MISVYKDGIKIEGLAKSRLYRIYRNMISRCYREKDCAYKYYGGKGIKVCEDWLGDEGFSKFYVWAINTGYQDNLTIDRIDSNDDYKPSNCRWFTIKQQKENTFDSNGITLKKKFSKYGKSAAIIIDKKIMKFCDFDIDDELDVVIRKNFITIRKSLKKEK